MIAAPILKLCALNLVGSSATHCKALPIAILAKIISGYRRCNALANTNSGPLNVPQSFKNRYRACTGQYPPSFCEMDKLAGGPEVLCLKCDVTNTNTVLEMVTSPNCTIDSLLVRE